MNRARDTGSGPARATLSPGALGTLVAGFMCVCLGGPAAAQTWSELGPAPITSGDVGRVSAIVCSPSNGNKYFVAGADGGVWRTTDGGATWTPLTDNMPTTAMGALALDPTNENIIYAGTGEANFANHSRYGLGIFKSTDGGNSWAHLAEPTFAGRCISRIIVSPANPQRVYAAVTRAGGFPEMAAAKSHPQRTGPLGVFRSDDGGVTWSQLTSGLPANTATDLAMDPSNSQVLYGAIGHIFGSPDNGIYKTTNGGNSWTKLGGGLPASGIGRIAIAVSPTQPARLFALLVNPSSSGGGGATTLGFYTSADSGSTWTTISSSSIQSSYGWYLCVASVNPGDPTQAFFGGLDFVRVKTNGPVEYITPPHVDCHAIAWDASGRLLVGDDGGVHRSSNLGTSWSAINTGLGTVQFYAGLSTSPSSDPFVFGGTQDNGTNRRSTNTKSWQRLIGGDGGWTQTDQTNPLRMFGEAQGTAELYRSTNGGSGFSYIGGDINGADRNCFLPPYLIDPTNAQRMFYATHRLWRSTNGGTNWTAISPDITAGAGAIRAIAMTPSNANSIYAATNDGRVLVSTNGGTSFTLRLSGIPGWPRVTREIFVDPTDAQTAYLAVAAFGTDQVRRTTNAGVSWQALDGDLPDIPVNVVAADVRCPTPVLYAGTDAGLYRSIDDGLTWRRYGQGLPSACIIDILIDTARERLVVGTQGRGAWSAPIRPVADFNGDGFVDGIDYDSFVNAFEAGDPSADFNDDGFVDGIDYDQFVIAFESGC